MIDPEQLKVHAERIRASQILGRSELIQRLFGFFVECSLAGRVPKEIEVALDVFGKRADFDVGQDAVVRVYIHKLRRKLDEYYAGPGRSEAARLVIPRGEYRFMLVEHNESVAVAPPADADLDAEVVEDALLMAPTTARRLWQKWGVAAMVLLLLFNLALLALRPKPSPVEQEITALRDSPVWARLLDDDLPIYIVVGDYFIFGELSDTSMEVQRMVREFGINSPTDLEQYLKNNPDLASRYMDIGLDYLPTSVAYALSDVMPMLQPNAKPPGQVRVVQASDLTPAMVRSAHVVYIGLFSGMGILHELAFNRSRLAVGESFDELVDRATGKRYMSQAAAIENVRGAYRDYGYFQSVTGPGGNQLVILAGTRDVALMQVAEALTHRNSMQALLEKAGGDHNIEALYAVDALDRSNIGGELVFATTSTFDAASSSSSSSASAQSSQGQ